MNFNSIPAGLVFDFTPAGVGLSVHEDLHLYQSGVGVPWHLVRQHPSVSNQSLGLVTKSGFELENVQGFVTTHFAKPFG